jgi:hypothetical protein
MPTTVLGQWLLGGLALFWLARAAVQAPFFGLRHPASIALTVAFMVGAALHAFPFMLRPGG